MSLKKSLLETFKGMSFSLSDAYEKFSSHYPKEQIRARIYESLGIAFKRIGRGVYFANSFLHNFQYPHNIIVGAGALDSPSPRRFVCNLICIIRTMLLYTNSG